MTDRYVETINKAADNLNWAREKIIEQAARIAELEAEVTDWRECAKYDAVVPRPLFLTWDRFALDRCRRQFIEPNK